MTATFEQTLTPFTSSDNLPYWSEILNFYEEGIIVPFSMLEKLSIHVKTSSISSQKSFHLFLRNFLALVLLETNAKNFDEIFYLMQKHAIFHDPSLYKAYYPLFNTLLNKQDTLSYLLLPLDQQRLFSIPSFNAEIGVLFFLHGLIKKDAELIEKGIESAFSQLDYLDSTGDFFKGAMRQESQATDAELYSIYSLLFSLASFFLPEERVIADIYKNFSAKLDQMNSVCSQETFLYSLLHVFFRRQLSLCYELADKKFDKPLQKSQGVILNKVKYLSEKSAALCSAQGDKLGFAFMKKHHVEFLSIGPQQGNIGEMSCYGSFSSFHKDADKEMIRIESSPKGFYFNTWLKCSDANYDHFSKNWLHVCAVYEKESLEITVKSLNFIEEEELHLLFFVKADKVIVDHTFHLSPHTLDRYEGKVAPLKFFKDQQPVILESSLNSTMKVIPLSGEGHFWGAEFLVAYSLPQEESVSFKID